MLLAALIWGAAFVAQKSAMEHMGPFTFSGTRFLMSIVVILPFVLKEMKEHAATAVAPADKWLIATVSIVFFAGVNLQQMGIAGTNITNAGFLTALYVVFVPFMSLFVFKKRPRLIVWVAAPLCLLGVWLLGDASLSRLSAGDLLVILCAFFFALHVVLVAVVMLRVPRPLTMAATQYAVCAALSLLAAAAFEDISLEAMREALPALLYAGIISGGIAYTLQIVAQQYTPASDAAIILSGEALFAALFGVLLMGDSLSPLAWTGCGVIFAAILLVELFPVRKKSDLDGNAGLVLRGTDRE